MLNLKQTLNGIPDTSNPVYYTDIAWVQVFYLLWHTGIDCTRYLLHLIFKLNIDILI